jgi:hypothetical protein
MGRFKDEIGNVYGKLTVIEFIRTDKQTSFWRCLCECGDEKTTRGNTLRSGQCKSCGKCDIQKPTSTDAPLKRQWRSLCKGANERGLENNLTYNDFVDIVHQRCYCCNSEPYDKHYAYSRRRKTRGIEFDVCGVFNGVDRIDSSIGYTHGNVRSCCSMCNRMKTDFELSIFLKKVKQIYEYNDKKTGNNPRN